MTALRHGYVWMLLLVLIGCGSERSEECGEGLTDCSGVCVDLDVEVTHCGSCTRVCVVDNGTPGCVDGDCVVDSCQTPHDDCDGEVPNGCETDTSSDAAHCGGCGNDCPAGETCQSGACGDDCTGSLTRCGDVCVDTDTDVAHCGGCSQACQVANGTPACSGGECSVATCTEPYADCDEAYATGCEINTDTDPDHCGDCDQPCTQDQVCDAGLCDDSCGAGLTDCGGSCVNTDTDPGHCGGCDNACSVANGDPDCQAGDCVVVACTAPWDDCDTEYDTGCETDTSQDIDHCGSCDNACPDGEVCQLGDCALSCADGMTECDGACVDTSSDPEHCGGCGEACSVAHGTAGCADSACTVAACTAPWDDCDGEVPTGCEANTSNDAHHCGGCDDACPDDETCVGGGCQGGAVLPDERASEPVVLAGASFPAFAGQDVSDVFVLVFDAAAGWVQIPHQVDERHLAHLWSGSNCPDGCELRYVFDGDDEGNGLDDDDEVVFMAAHLAGQASGPPPEGAEGDGYEVQVVLPGEGIIGYAYVFRSSTWQIEFSADLVGYDRTVLDPDTEDTDVMTANYRVHFSRLWVEDAIAVLPDGGGDGVDLVDRFKGRAYARSLSGETEDIIGMCGGWSNHDPDWGQHTYLGHVDGPVRAIRAIQGACSWPNLTRVDVFYEGRAEFILNIRGHAFNPGENGIWGYWDYEQAALPMTYYNPLVPDGTLIDGVNDPAYPNGDVGPEITAGWDQVDSAHGGIVFAFAETIDVPGPINSFFFDDLSYDDGTGDDPSPDPGVIGGSGFHLQHVGNTDPMIGGTPGQVTFFYWPVPADAGNVGEAYAETMAVPLQASVGPYD